MSELELIQKLLVDTLTPLSQQGVTVRPLPADLKIGVSRTAMIYPFVAGFSDDVVVRDDSPLKPPTVGTRRYQAYIIVLGFELVRPSGVLSLCESIIRLLNSCQLRLGSVDLGIKANSSEFTSAEAGLWQYRIPVDISRPLFYRGEDDIFIANYEQ